MKVAVITRHAITNYGSLLQAVATQRVIEGLGHTCEIIDYVRKDESYRQHEKTILQRKLNWNNNPVKRLVYLAVRQPISILSGRKFEKYQKELLQMTKRFSCLDELCADAIDADVFMTGSDQVWGPVENGSYDSSYCLSFTDKKKISYAASFGHTDMNEKLQAYYQKWLSRYTHISVREDSAVKMIEALGFNATQVIDPTLLIEASEWKKYIKNKPKKKYILVYQLHNDKRLGDYAKKVARMKGLPLIRISTAFHQINRGGYFIWCPDISGFLSYICNAECMITDSFHGTAFAINFNTPFVEVLPNNNTGTRNMSILKLTGLLDRILQNYDDIQLADKPIDFTFANSVLEECRVHSTEIMKSMIEE